MSSFYCPGANGMIHGMKSNGAYHVDFNLNLCKGLNDHRNKRGLWTQCHHRLH